MNWLIWYIRSWFCKHNFDYCERDYIVQNDFGQTIKNGPKVSATCTKCGYHKSYWKF